jgi:hypothetical protein
MTTVVKQKAGLSAYQPTKAEVAAIRKGEAEIARGEFVTLADCESNQANRPPINASKCRLKRDLSAGI